MASSQDAQAIANNWEAASTAFLAALNGLRDAVRYNASHAIDWGNQTPPAEIPLAVNGNVDGFQFTPAELSNVIGSADSLITFLDSNGHTGNFQKVGRPS